MEDLMDIESDVGSDSMDVSEEIELDAVVFQPETITFAKFVDIITQASNRFLPDSMEIDNYDLILVIDFLNLLHRYALQLKEILFPLTTEDEFTNDFFTNIPKLTEVITCIIVMVAEQNKGHFLCFVTKEFCNQYKNTCMITAFQNARQEVYRRGYHNRIDLAIAFRMKNDDKSCDDRAIRHIATRFAEEGNNVQIITNDQFRDINTAPYANCRSDVQFLSNNNQYTLYNTDLRKVQKYDARIQFHNGVPLMNVSC
jgi:hypothetical protein